MTNYEQYYFWFYSYCEVYMTINGQRKRKAVTSMKWYQIFPHNALLLKFNCYDLFKKIMNIKELKKLISILCNSEPYTSVPSNTAQSDLFLQRLHNQKQDYLPVELVTLVEVVFTVWLLLTRPSAGDALTFVESPLFVVVTFVLLKFELAVVVVSYYKENKSIS